MSQEKSVIGSLVFSAPNPLDGNHGLGLVVAQEAGKNWAEKDPCIEYDIPEEYGPLLVRVLGLKLTTGRALYKSSLPEREPCGTETVRWAFVQTKPNPLWVVAGPSVESIEDFLRQCRLFGTFGIGEPTFLHEVALLVEYLRGVTRTKEAMSHFDRQFFAMLRDVLPR